ncbi:MAG: mannonate dehydratase, partial [Sphaerochaetaceae bacterium]|nr:mannonate dehydratase [Sphaerochaetaceae bacterium]
MVMTFRWFGENYDSVSLDQIRQIACVKGVVSTLYDKLPGQIWKREEVHALKAQIEKKDLILAGIESVNIHYSIKVGSPERDKYIDNYIKTLEILGQEDIHMVCYNFMPVFDWTRSDLAKLREDGSTVMSYDQELVDKINVDDFMNHMNAKSNNFKLAGWEPERLAHIRELFEMYQSVTQESLFDNLCYFLKAIMPVCDKYDINMAIHPDDPAWPVFKLPRIVKGQEDLVRLFKAVDNVHNGVTLCTGSLGSNPNNDIPTIIKACKGRIHFAHIRNLRYLGEGKFDEAAHISSDGSLDMFAIMKALYDVGFDGPIRP